MNRFNSKFEKYKSSEDDLNISCLNIGKERDRNKSVSTCRSFYLGSSENNRKNGMFENSCKNKCCK